MKPYSQVKALLCLIVLTVFANSYIFSQCGNGAFSSSISYDTVFRGGGNSNYNIDFPQFDTSRIYLNFPQFDPSKGTLVSVEIETIISVKYTYTLENLDIIQMISRIKMNRSDIINSPALMAPFEEFKSKTVATHILSAAIGLIGLGTDFVAAGPLYAYKNQPVVYNLTNNLAGFMGGGSVPFNYETQTDLFPSGAKYLWNPTTEDSVYFRLTYNYCTTSLLPAEINNFNAIKLFSGNLQLSWNAPNDIIGNKYEMQKSTDGRNYTAFQSLIAKTASSNNYQVNYTPGKDDKAKIFFRIKQEDVDGSAKYSTVKTVALEYTSSTMKVFPTVAKSNVNISFPYASKADYQVSILSLGGQLMQQSVFNRTSRINLPLNSRLKPGMYLVSVVNKQTLETQQSKLVIE